MILGLEGLMTRLSGTSRSPKLALALFSQAKTFEFKGFACYFADFMIVKVLYIAIGNLYLTTAYLRFRSMKRLGIFLLSLDGILVHRRLPSSTLSGCLQNNLLVPTYTSGWREAL